MNDTTRLGLRSRLAIAATVTWTRLYTALSPAEVRRDRRKELASDLHEHREDLRARHVSDTVASMEILRRTVAGIPDDVSWALTTVEGETIMLGMRTMAVTGWAVALVMSVLALFMAVQDLADGWRELPGHWWSALAAAGVLGAVGGLALTILIRRSGDRSTGTSPSGSR